MSIAEIAEGILHQHDAQIAKRAEEGNVRCLELLWIEANKEIHGRVAMPLTDKERGNLALLIKGLGGAEVRHLLIDAVQYWTYLLGQASLADKLPPYPTFGALFAYRETIRSFLDGREKKQSRNLSTTEKLKRYEQESAETERPKISLLEMAKAARLKIQQQKEEQK